jgi:hypothetical protein
VATWSRGPKLPPTLKEQEAVPVAANRACGGRYRPRSTATTYHCHLGKQHKIAQSGSTLIAEVPLGIDPVASREHGPQALQRYHVVQMQLAAIDEDTRIAMRGVSTQWPPEIQAGLDESCGGPAFHFPCTAHAVVPVRAILDTHTVALLYAATSWSLSCTLLTMT